MGEHIRLKSAAGEIGAYLAAPKGTPKGGIVVIQEIFGVNAHVRAVTEGFAADGYLAIAPSLFDRVRRDVALGYSAPEVEEGRGYMLQLPQEKVTLDIASALAVVRHAGVQARFVAVARGAAGQEGLEGGQAAGDVHRLHEGLRDGLV